MEDNEYRYAYLTGSATVTRSAEVIHVNLHDSQVNPYGKCLKFDHPLDSDPDSSPATDGDFPIQNVHIVAALNRAWFQFHTETNGFHFKKKDGQPVQNWEDLDKPLQLLSESANLVAPRMDPVRP
jgi:hypothetical protein